MKDELANGFYANCYDLDVGIKKEEKLTGKYKMEKAYLVIPSLSRKLMWNYKGILSV